MKFILFTAFLALASCTKPRAFKNWYLVGCTTAYCNTTTGFYSHDVECSALADALQAGHPNLDYVYYCEFR